MVHIVHFQLCTEHYCDGTPLSALLNERFVDRNVKLWAVIPHMHNIQPHWDSTKFFNYFNHHSTNKIFTQRALR